AAGHIVATGNINTATKNFDFQGRAEGVEISRLAALTSQPGLPPITGIVDFTAHIVGNVNLKETGFAGYQITFDGTARDVTINGKSAGTVELVGRTENKQL